MGDWDRIFPVLPNRLKCKGQGGHVGEAYLYFVFNMKHVLMVLFSRTINNQAGNVATDAIRKICRVRGPVHTSSSKLLAIKTRSTCTFAIVPEGYRTVPDVTAIWHSQKAVRRQKGIPDTDLDPEDWDSTSRGLAGGDMMDLQRAVDTRPLSRAKSVVIDETCGNEGSWFQSLKHYVFMGKLWGQLANSTLLIGNHYLEVFNDGRYPPSTPFGTSLRGCVAEVGG
ncbi:uncharacterized protein RAG0_08298 [Rhynchosporium agropyri]|uniref:Uncharacterized protein n=1 Tax=Rhynchosporium agropyri TaxID=914238 RepID=A0A1E1KQ42_9HELO|nr:uncharacterized protein RAG0_08298 [Rhynchosporium agropyri]